jgi:small conductance mechanosensitive channel
VAYDSDLEKVRGVINAVGAEQAKHGDWRDEIIEPIEFLRVDAFGDHAVIIKAIGKVQPAKQWDVAGDFRLRLKNAFDKAGIVIPYPQVVVHQAKKSS